MYIILFAVCIHIGAINISFYNPGKQLVINAMDSATVGLKVHWQQ